MKTPIYDAVSTYVKSHPTRAHMPGHKGIGSLGVEYRDVTEIDGMDVLYHESGILSESQRYATNLFGSQATLYSTEGSTLSIRAMLYLAKLYASDQGIPFQIAAGRNAHKAFLTSCALLDIEPMWLCGEDEHLLTNSITPDSLDSFFSMCKIKPSALYITSPDYLGNISDVLGIAEVCHKHGAILLVDNAHGAYLRFLPDSNHPLDKGADLVCDSAHKTLPVLTGGAYLHISKNAPKFLAENAPRAMTQFSSSSPSYLILQSLDLCNEYLRNCTNELYSFSAVVHDLKKELKQLGFDVLGNEPLKITLRTKVYGYRGDDVSGILQNCGVYCEFSDPDHVVLMLTPNNRDEDLQRIISVFRSIPKKDPILEFPPSIPRPISMISPKEAMLSPAESLPVEQCVGRILATASVSCPPAIPIAVCGEKISDQHVHAFTYYGIKTIEVVR